MTEQENPFSQMFASWAKAWDGAAAQDQPFSSLMQAFDPRRWLGLGSAAIEQPMETLLGLPRFAFPPLDRQLLALAGGWLLLMQRSSEHGVKVMRSWSDAYTELCAELNEAAAKGEPVHAGRELVERIVTVLNRKMQDVQRSEDFLASQRKLLDALLSSRTHEREVIELIANLFDLPTRTEMDDAHRSVHDLKREVRALRREVDRIKRDRARSASAGAPAPPAAERPDARAKGAAE